MNHTPPARNNDLQRMHGELIGLVRRLELSIDEAPDAAAISTIAEQIAEVNSRVTATGRILLARQTDEIAQLTKAVSETIPEIEAELDELVRQERLVRSVAVVLGTVDEALRVATLVCG